MLVQRTWEQCLPQPSEMDQGDDSLARHAKNPGNNCLLIHCFSVQVGSNSDEKQDRTVGHCEPGAFRVPTVWCLSYHGSWAEYASCPERMRLTGQAKA